MIRSIVFDIGNVLLPFDFGIALKRLQPFCAGPVLDAMEKGDPVKAAYEAGRIGRADFLKQAIELLGFSGTEAQFVSAWEEIFEENLAMTELVEGLHAHYPLYLLSNTSDLHIDYVVQRYPVFARFADAVYSYKVGCLKPDPAIYEIAARQFGIVPQETVFIDDLLPNIESARAVGYHGILYDHRNHGALVEELRGLGVRVPK